MAAKINPVRLNKFTFRDHGESQTELKRVLSGSKRAQYTALGLSIITLYNAIPARERVIQKPITSKILVDVTEDPNSGFQALLEALAPFQSDASQLHVTMRLNIMYALVGLAFRELNYKNPKSVVEKMINLETEHHRAQAVDYLSLLNTKLLQQTRSPSIKTDFYFDELNGFFRVTTIAVNDFAANSLFEYEMQKDEQTHDWKWFACKKEAEQYAARMYLRDNPL